MPLWDDSHIPIPFIIEIIIIIIVAGSLWDGYSQVTYSAKEIYLYPIPTGWVAYPWVITYPC